MHSGPGGYESVLKDCELIVRRLNAGADGFNRWSFLNRGDLDGAWQFIETLDRQAGKLLQDFTPYPNTYFGLGLLSRFTAKHSAVLACRVEGGTMQQWQRVFAVALRSPQGHLTLAVVNDAPQEFDLALDLEGLAEARPILPLWHHRPGPRPRRSEDRPAAGIPAIGRQRRPPRSAPAAKRDGLFHLPTHSCGPRHRGRVKCQELTPADLSGLL